MRMKNPQAIITSVSLIVLGVGLMGLSAHDSIMDSIGGGLFLIGCAIAAYFLIHELKR